MVWGRNPGVQVHVSPHVHKHNSFCKNPDQIKLRFQPKAKQSWDNLQRKNHYLGVIWGDTYPFQRIFWHQPPVNQCCSWQAPRCLAQCSHSFQWKLCLVSSVPVMESLRNLRVWETVCRRIFVWSFPTFVKAQPHDCCFYSPLDMQILLVMWTVCTIV